MSASAQMIGTVLSGRYRLEAKLGSGGMSTVYLARDETLDRLVAVKVMHREISEQAEQLQRFNAEARAVAQLSHPHVVQVIDAGEDGGHPYIVLEYVEGETLKQRINRLGRLPVDEAVAYAIEIGQGLVVAHARQMVHRDVKPQNVLIDPDGRAKVTDFGIARKLEEEGVTATGRVLGTTDYVSPEQAMGQAVDPRSDVYSLGVVLYEMLVGDVPFHADSLVGVAMKHVNEDLPDVQRRRAEVSSAVAAVIERATAKDPERRYQSLGEMLEDLEAALEVEAARATTHSEEATSVLDAVPPARRRLKPSRTSIAGVLAVLAAIAIAVAAVALISSGEVGGGGAGGGTSEEVAILAATDFDPEGDEEEHADEVARAIDQDPNSAWTTETYTTSPVMADNGKSGVGLILEPEGPVAASLLEVRSARPGWSLEVRAADEPVPDEIGGWQVVGEADVVERTQTVEIDTGGTEYGRYLVWITSLADEPEGFRVEITEAKLRA